MSTIEEIISENLQARDAAEKKRLQEVEETVQFLKDHLAKVINAQAPEKSNPPVWQEMEPFVNFKVIVNPAASSVANSVSLTGRAEIPGLAPFSIGVGADLIIALECGGCGSSFSSEGDLRGGLPFNDFLLALKQIEIYNQEKQKRERAEKFIYKLRAAVPEDFPEANYDFLVEAAREAGVYEKCVNEQTPKYTAKIEEFIYYYLRRVQEKKEERKVQAQLEIEKALEIERYKKAFQVWWPVYYDTLMANQKATAIIQEELQKPFTAYILSYGVVVENSETNKKPLVKVEKALVLDNEPDPQGWWRALKSDHPYCIEKTRFENILKIKEVNGLIWGRGMARARMFDAKDANELVYYPPFMSTQEIQKRINDVLKPLPENQMPRYKSLLTHHEALKVVGEAIAECIKARDTPMQDFEYSYGCFVRSEDEVKK